MEAVLVPISFFAMIAAIFVAPRYFRSIERQKMADTLRAAIERGQPVPPEIIEAMSTGVRAPPSAGRDLRVGIVWLGVGAGLAALGLALSFEEPDALFPLLGCAAFPFFIGLAFVAMSFIGRGKT